LIKRTFWKQLLWSALIIAFFPIFFLAAVLPGRRRKLIWGSIPVITNRYWSKALEDAGWQSETLMQTYFSINRRDDFDHYFEDFAPSWLPLTLRRGLGACVATVHVLRRARVVHLSFEGLTLGTSWLWRTESAFFRLAGIRVVALPFGSDFYRYSEVVDTSMRYGLLASYPELARREVLLRRKRDHWVRYADALIAGMMIDGIGRWDVTLNQFFHIDTKAWTPKPSYSDADGSGAEPVRVLHTPNHRGFKGTEYLVDAVDRLRAEGLNVELIMLEGVPNSEVRAAMQAVDILAEQFLATGYALSGIEGMASGLPVLANLEHEAYTRVYRRYGFLNECPILSTTPETLTDNLRLLIKNPKLREDLGRAGRAYAEKYHSYAMAQYMFGAVYDRILHGKDLDLINLFHPLKSEYNRGTPRVSHPLVENRLPPDSAYRQC
jgi:glycosyltransferase involved in cell wall biosynthesis